MHPGSESATYLKRRREKKLTIEGEQVTKYDLNHNYEFKYQAREDLCFNFDNVNWDLLLLIKAGNLNLCKSIEICK